MVCNYAPGRLRPREAHAHEETRTSPELRSWLTTYDEERTRVTSRLEELRKKIENTKLSDDIARAEHDMVSLKGHQAAKLDEQSVSPTPASATSCLMGLEGDHIVLRSGDVVGHLRVIDIIKLLE